MDAYEQKVLGEMMNWKAAMDKKSPVLQRMAKKVQVKINDKIPEKIHEMITESIKKMVQATIIGSNLTTKPKDTVNLSLQQKEQMVSKTIEQYKKTAAVEGAGTGAGGFLWGLADFPLLLSIKMKCLFDIASIYGFDIKKVEERIFVLYIFHLAFCSDELRPVILEKLEKWNSEPQETKEVNWRAFQQEYRDYIDFVKMFQLMPVIGAVVGAVANYRLLDHLGETAMNVYRLRLLKDGL
ncbi:MAG TPA: EcsC family protein [Bacillus sp. (in: firmicutes)]|nr:EcsC family protein [Bacillus sp. (in: firmicutes)]